MSAESANYSLLAGEAAGLKFGDHLLPPGMRVLEERAHISVSAGTVNPFSKDLLIDSCREIVEAQTARRCDFSQAQPRCVDADGKEQITTAQYRKFTADYIGITIT